VVKRQKEPHWLNRTIVDSVHTDQLREHGGLAGIRDRNALESALARGRNKWNSGEGNALAVLAAAYGLAFVTSHPYRDGNKRIGFLAIAAFLDINGHDLQATDADVVTQMLGLAAGQISEPELADWIRDHMTA
jgi:death-on-curing protein